MTQTAQGLDQALTWVGFRALTPAEASSGPFAQQRDNKRYIRFEPAAYLIAFVTEIESDVSKIRFLEHIEHSAWGYDLNLGQRASSTDSVQEFWFVVTSDVQSATEELRWLGYRPEGSFWIRSDASCSVPALDPGYEGEIFPCLGWVPDPDGTSEFAHADQRSGFCSKVVPDGAQFVRDVRGYQFVYAGYQQRMIPRRRIIAFIEPQKRNIDASAIVGKALMHSYGAA